MTRSAATAQVSNTWLATSLRTRRGTQQRYYSTSSRRLDSSCLIRLFQRALLTTDTMDTQYNRLYCNHERRTGQLNQMRKLETSGKSTAAHTRRGTPRPLAVGGSIRLHIRGGKTSAEAGLELRHHRQGFCDGKEKARCF